MKDKIIVVEQKPIIRYSLLEQISKEVVAKIESLNIDNIEANEDTLKNVKNTRTELKKEFTTLEEQRKMVKEIVLKDYNEFEDTYKRLIAGHYKDADAKLKDLVYTVEDKILQKKIDGIKDFFDGENQYSFLAFEDLNIKIIKSRSDKSIKEEIIQFLAQVEQNLNTISTLEHADRVLAKYQISKDLNSAISQTNIEVQREETIRKQKEERERLAKEREEQRALETKQQVAKIKDSSNLEHTPEEETVLEVTRLSPDPVFKTSFTVKGTKQQLSELKAFMIKKGIEIL